MDTIDVYKHIAKCHPEITAFQIVSFEAQKDLANEYSNSWSDVDEDYYQKALSLRAKLNLPFWNSLMLSIKNGDLIPENCLKGAYAHHSIHYLGCIQANNVDELSELINKRSRLAINSRVRTHNGIDCHIPMLDFHIQISERNTQLVKEICMILDQPGFILNSGHSYHFIGTRLQNNKQLISFLGKSLLFTPIVDEIWVAHQLQDNSCSLRFTLKHGSVPIVIDKVGF